VVSTISLVSGILEAVVLLLVVAAALSLTDGSRLVVSLPVVPDAGVAVGVGLIIAAGAALAVILLHVVCAWLTAVLAGHVLHEARARVVRAVCGAAWDRQARDREGALQETAMTLAVETANLVPVATSWLMSVTALTALLAAALAVDPLASVVVALLGLVVVLVFAPLRRLTYQLGSAFTHRNAEFAEEVSQWATLAQEHRVFGVEDQRTEAIVGGSAATSRALVRDRFTSLIGVSLFRDLAVLFLVAAVGGLHLLGDIDLGAVGSVVILVLRTLQYAQGAQSSLQSLSSKVANLGLLLERVGSLEAEPARRGSTAADSFGTLEVRGVSYAYEAGTPVLHDLSLQLTAGESVGVIGPSGAGKTTLGLLLVRLRAPSGGVIAVDGTDVGDIDPVSWSRLVALVPQEPRLFAGSVAENIAFMRPEISRAQVEAAAAEAQVIDDIRRLPAGFDTVLGPGGSGLSGGQKQRIAFARALVGAPSLLVLDEPTSALDARSEELLQQTIVGLRGRVTLVVIAHRTSTLRVCDRVLAIVGGRIVADGRLQDAMATVAGHQPAVPRR
jgi:ABC-type multidrug transport system fused ATPase/permease subunit